jgi:hypothetical protein
MIDLSQINVTRLTETEISQLQLEAAQKILCENETILVTLGEAIFEGLDMKYAAALATEAANNQLAKAKSWTRVIVEINRSLKSATSK